MKRLLPLAALAVLALIAVFFWVRSDARSDRAAEFGRLAADLPQADAPDLAAPNKAESTEARVQVAESIDSEPTNPASTWTGVRVHVTAIEDGRPLAGVQARVRIPNARQSWKDLDGSHGSVEEEPRSDANGIVELEFDAGLICSIYVSTDDGSTSSESLAIEPPLAPNEVRELAVVLRTRPDIVLHGRVIDRETNAPIPGARIGRSAGFGKIAADTEQRTDADGRFQLEGSSWRRQVVGVIRTGYEFAAFAIAAGYESAESALEIAIAPVASVRVTVLDAAGAPMPGLRATFSTAQYHFGRPDGSPLLDAGWIDEAYFAAVTDTNGVAVIEELPPRMPLDGVLHRGGEELLRAPEKLTLTPGELRAVEWRIGSGCVIHGIALESDGRPAVGLSICLEAARVMPTHYFEPSSIDPRRFENTDAEGRFVFADVGPGDWWVGPAPKKPGRKRAVEPEDVAACARTVVVPPATPRVDVEIRVHRGITIEGHVLDPTGNPVRSAFVQFGHPDERQSGGENMNDDEGHFVVGPIEPGEYELRASSGGRYVDSLPVRVQAGDTDVVLRLREGAKIEGLVVDATTGQPCAAKLCLMPLFTGAPRIMFPESDSQGKFSLDGLDEGAYAIGATALDGRTGTVARVELRPGAQTVRVEVRPAARVRLRFEGPWPNVQFAVYDGDVAVAMDGMAKGTERTVIVPAGRATLRLTKYPERTEFSLPLNLEAGATRDVVFDGAWK